MNKMLLLLQISDLTFRCMTKSCCLQIPKIISQYSLSKALRISTRNFRSTEEGVRRIRGQKIIINIIHREENINIETVFR